MCRYEKAEIQFPKKKAGTLYIMTDGAAVNTRQKDSSGSSWRENRLGPVFSSDHIYHWTSARGTHEHKILKREYISLIGTSDVFKKHLLALVVRNGYGEYDHTIILSDGATWIHNIKEELFPDAQQIPVYLLNPLQPLIFQGFPPTECSNLMRFPLFLPLRAEIRETFYFPPTTLSSSRAEVRFASLVEWA